MNEERIPEKVSNMKIKLKHGTGRQRSELENRLGKIPHRKKE
jgi:hypothetical protein